MLMISSSILLGSDFSTRSLILGIIRLNAALIMNILTMIAASGSSIIYLSPRKNAPPIPIPVPIDESASLL